MKYNWCLRRFWWSWFKQDIKRWCYKNIHGFNMDGLNGTILPITGKGQFVSVYTKGKIIQIKHEEGYPNLEYDEIRIIPYQPNHGVMVETLKDGKMCGRHLLDIRQLNKNIIFASNVEDLATRGKKEKTYSEKDLLSFGKSCFYKGFDKSENDDANCYTAFREEIGGLLEQFKK